MRMIQKDKKGYTLAEIMIVILILTIIFAAFAPLFTGRIKKSYKSKYNVWSWANYTGYDAFSASTTPTNTNEMIFGASPNTGDDINTIFAPLSRIIIRSGEVTQAALPQRQIQFRYGRTTAAGTNPYGTFAGSWFVDGSNYLLGGGYKALHKTIYVASDGYVCTGSGINPASGLPCVATQIKALENTAIGYNALNSVTPGGKGNTAIGYYALSKVTSASNNVAVGSLAGYSTTTAGHSTFVGAGSGYSNLGSKNIAIGYNAMKNAKSGYNNTFVGSNVAGSGVTTGHDNVAVGEKALYNLTSGTQNVAIGYNALGSLTTGSNNVAIGYNACSEVTTGSNKTCIGYNSGPHQYNRNAFKSTNSWELRSNNELTNKDNEYKYKSTADFLKGRTDTTMRTYIGSRPYNYGGDAVLEIHNPTSYNMGIKGSINDPQTSYFNTTTVINGNLIVRGRPYFTIGTTLHHFTDVSHTPDPSKPNAIAYFYGKNGSGNVTTYGQCATNALSYNFSSGCINLKTTAAPTTTSDRRLKNIDGKFTAGMDRLRDIKVYNYTFKNDKDKQPHVGVIAQELQKVFPTAVFQVEDGYLRIRWDEMFYAMINGIKEIDRRIIAIVKRTTNVETQISQLEKENNQLKTQVDELTVRVNKLKAQ